MIYVGIFIALFLFIGVAELCSIGKTMEGIEWEIERNKAYLEGAMQSFSRSSGTLMAQLAAANGEIRMLRETIEPVCKKMLVGKDK